MTASTFGRRWWQAWFRRLGRQIDAAEAACIPAPEPVDLAFAAFIAAYPAEHHGDAQRARSRWDNLSATDRAAAIRELPRWLDEQRGARRFPLAAVYLEDRRWQLTGTAADRGQESPRTNPGRHPRAGARGKAGR